MLTRWSGSCTANKGHLPTRDHAMRFPKYLGRLGMALVVASTPAFAGPYNAVDDFSLGSNPNGSWSYLSNGSLMTSAENPCVVESSVAGLICWQNSGSDAAGTLG